MTITSTTDHGTTRDGLIQLRRRWEPTGSARAAVVLIHGLGEHSGRYEHVGGHLADAGFDVVSIDNRGFGGSGGKRAFVESFAQFHDDVEDQLAEVRRLGLPTVLLGHSLGALISTGYCITDRPKPDALVVTGPPLGYELEGPDKALKVVGPLIRRVRPGYEVRDDWDASVFAEDITVGETFMNDPLRTDFMTISLALETIGEIERVRDGVTSLELPAWVGHGGVDKIVPVWASEPFEGVAIAERTVYDGLGHEILNEPVGLDIVDDMIRWITTTLAI